MKTLHNETYEKVICIFRHDRFTQEQIDAVQTKLSK